MAILITNLNRLQRQRMVYWTNKLQHELRKMTPVGEGEDGHLRDAWKVQVYRKGEQLIGRVYLQKKDQQKYKYAFGPRKAKRIRPKNPNSVFRAYIGRHGEAVFFKSYMQKARPEAKIIRKMINVTKKIEKRAQKDIDRRMKKRVSLLQLVENFFGLFK